MTAQVPRRSTAPSARPRRPKKGTPARAATRADGTGPGPGGGDTGSTPPPQARITAAAKQALDVAASTETAAGVPVRVRSMYPLDTGLVDYGLWVEMFSHASSPPEAPEHLRRGRIWA